MTAELDAMVDAAESRLGSLRESAGALDLIRARVTSPDSSVTVVADGFGAMIALELVENLGSIAARTLAATITETAAAAASCALDQRENLLKTLHVSFTDS